MTRAIRQGEHRPAGRALTIRRVLDCYSIHNAKRQTGFTIPS